MVSQLKRSAARKELTKLCSMAILDYLATNTSPKSSTGELSETYQLAVNIVLGVAIETMTLKSIPEQLTESGGILELLENISHTIGTVRDQKSIEKNHLIYQNKPKETGRRRPRRRIRTILRP